MLHIKETKVFSYGPNNGCDIWMALMFAPLGFFGFFPPTAYNRIVFNQNKQQIEKYSKGYGLWYNCFTSSLQQIIPYANIVSLKHEKQQAHWKSKYGQYTADVHILNIVLSDGKSQKIYVPQNACYLPEDRACHCCCPYRPGVTNSVSCCVEKYHQICEEIVEYWEQINGNYKSGMTSASPIASI